MGGLFDSDLIPILFAIVMALNIFLDKKKRRKRKQQVPQQESADEPAKGDDIAADFERRLKKTMAKAKAQKQSGSARQRIRRDDAAVLHDGTNVRRDSDVSVHHDGEAVHDSTGRVHHEQEAFAHDKGRVYRDPRSDYSYDEEQMNTAAAAFNAHYAQAARQEERPRIRLRHKALVNGVIMAEVLGKPKALNGGSENF